MRRLFLFLVLLAMVGCGPNSPQTPGSLPSAPQASTPTAVAMATMEDATTATPAASPGTGAPAPTLSPREVSPAASGLRTVTPVITPTTAARATPSPGPAVTLTRGWLTYVSAAWHVAVDYPPDWTVRVESAAVTFSSPNGATIQLASRTDNSADSEDMPNVRCQSRTNAQGIIARVCLDTIAMSEQASFAVPQPGGSPRPLALLTGRRRGDQAVFVAMLASLRAVRGE